jgi:hypothetical protein
LELKQYIISGSSNIREAIKKIDDNGEGLIFVVDNSDEVILSLSVKLNQGPKNYINLFYQRLPPYSTTITVARES